MSGIESVEAREAEFYAAQTASDTAKLAGIFAEDLVFVHSKGLVDTRASYLDAVATGRFAHGPIYRVSGTTRVADDGTGAVSIGVIDMVIRSAGQPEQTVRLHQALVWRRGETGWLLVSRQATRQPL